MRLSDIVRKIAMGKKASSESYIKHLRSIGIRIGERTTVFTPFKTIIDEQYPWLISIGDDVQITAGVTILTHDYSWAVIKKAYGPILGAAGRVKIGNNVFIGVNSVILGGTEIGDNVVIGAGSIVKGKIPDNCVAVGNPCKVVCSLEKFYEKRKEKQIDEAEGLAAAYYQAEGKMPPQSLFHEFFYLFESDGALDQVFDDKLKLLGNYEKSRECLESGAYKKYENYNVFMEHAIAPHTGQNE